MNIHTEKDFSKLISHVATLPGAARKLRLAAVEMCYRHINDVYDADEMQQYLDDVIVETDKPELNLTEMKKRASKKPMNTWNATFHICRDQIDRAIKEVASSTIVEAKAYFESKMSKEDLAKKEAEWTEDNFNIIRHIFSEKPAALPMRPFQHADLISMSTAVYEGAPAEGLSDFLEEYYGDVAQEHIEHLRTCSAHISGCYILDSILGK